MPFCAWFMLAVVAALLASAEGQSHQTQTQTHRKSRFNIEAIQEEQWTPFETEGDEQALYNLFYTAKPTIFAHGFNRTRGLAVLGNTGFVSDTVFGTVFVVSEEDGLEVVLRNAGQCGGAQIAECGAPGLEISSKSPYSLVVSQYGAQRLVRFDLRRRTRQILVDKFNGMPFNGPHEVLLSRQQHGVVYFTDPVFRFMNSTHHHDSKHLDQQSALGFEGLFRARVPLNDNSETTSPSNDVELLAKLLRPAGLGFSPDNTKLYVSHCCEIDISSPTTSSPSCKPGRAMYTVFTIHPTAQTLAKSHSFYFDLDGPGCSDGFAVDTNTGHIISSCPGGLCVIDPAPTPAQLLARLVFGGGMVSNVRLADNLALIAAQNAVFSLPRRRQPLQEDYSGFRFGDASLRQAAIHDEL